MKLKQRLRNKWQTWTEAIIFRLARPDALLHLAFFGLVTGFLAGGVIVLFRLLVEEAQDFLLPGSGSENYEALLPGYLFLFPVIGSVLLALLFYYWSKGIRVLGIARIMERVAYHQGHMTLRGFFLQFFGAAIAIVSGHSVGREGPHAYLGAGISSLFGQLIKLPNNSIRTLVACGAAAGISASFNTPLAGVIFALEVIMMEYALHSFIPVMLAAVTATALSNYAFGNEAAFTMPAFEGVELSALPIVLMLGLIVGTFAAIFNHLLTMIASRAQVIEIWWRILLAGVIVGLIGMIKPEILGIGYDSVNASLLGGFTLTTLITLALLKMLATSVSVGLGVPGGMIGPALFIGATLGGAVGFMANKFLGVDASYIGFYAVLGMGAMMGASLQAPLAALTAIVELTYNPGIIMPAMLAIVVAQLTASELFNKQSLFVTMLRSNGLDYSINPVMQVLRSVGVASVLNKKFQRHSPTMTREKIDLLLQSGAEWVIINDKDGEISTMMSVTELAKSLHREGNEEEMESDSEVDLLKIPARRMDVAPISLQANLMQAHEYLEKGVDALYVVYHVPKISANSHVYGVLTRSIVEKAYIPNSP